MPRFDFLEFRSIWAERRFFKNNFRDFEEQFLSLTIWGSNFELKKKNKTKNQENKKIYKIFYWMI